MTTLPGPAMARASWPRALWLLLAASLALSLWITFRYPLLEPDEGRNAEVAREMAVSGDVVIPHLAGMPYLDKPPALFAFAALAIRAFGPTAFAARLPAMLAGLLTLALLARLALRESGPEQAVRVVAFTAAAPLFAVLSAYVIFDMPLTLCVTAVWTLLADELREPGGRAAARRTLMFLALALGILVKGPVMLAWVLGGSAVAALLLRERAPLAWLAWWPGWLIVVALAGGWFALALARHPEYAHYAFVEESLERMTSGSFKREQPWWFVPVVLAGGALPWSLATPWRWPQARTARLAAGFVLFAAIFFTLSHSKLVTYLLPAIPALAYVAADAWGRRRVALPRPLLAALLLSPTLLILGSPWLLPVAKRTSDDALARAIRDSGGGAVRCEDCYTPGADFLLGRGAAVVSATGIPLTSNYVVRYRGSLRQRGQWRLFDSTAVAPPADCVVRESQDAGTPPVASHEIYRDARLIAWRRDTPR